MASILNPQIPSKSGQSLHWSGLQGCAESLALAALAPQHEQIIVVCEDTLSMHQLASELAFFSGDDAPSIFEFPDWECLPYDRVSPHQDLVSQRLATLYQLASGQPGVYLLPASALLQRICPPEYILAKSFQLAVGQDINLESLKSQLIHGGYYSVDQVMAAGEFAIRGGIIDVFPSGAESPFRLDLFDTTIESIKLFDPESQRSTEQLTEFNLLPAREFPLDEAGVRHFRQAFRATFDGDPKKALIYNAVSDGFPTPGIEFYLPLFFESTASFFDYCSSNAVFAFIGQSLDNVTVLFEEAGSRYENAVLSPDWPPLEPQNLFLTQEQIFSELKRFVRISIATLNLKNEKHLINYDTAVATKLNLNLRLENPYQDLAELVKNTEVRTLLVAESAGRRENLLGVLSGLNCPASLFNSWQDFVQSDATLGIVTNELDRGSKLNELGIQIITEAELYGRQSTKRRPRSERNRDPDAIIKSLAELKIGDPIVHEDHGVGRYQGLDSLQIGNLNNEFAVVEYQDGDRIYIPVLSLDKVSRYVGGSPESAPLHKMGSDTWIKITKRAKEKAYDVAAELLEVQALRLARVGHAFPNVDDGYTAFSAGFGFEETPDQQQVIDDVVSDMVAPKPMDRLVCGDVGFGKTEIALRAAYMAISGNKQVAVLVPTTLLAQQHFDNFTDRFADWPVKIELFSRFRSGKQTTAALDGIKDGTVDIAVGTHKLIQKDIVFKDLGLLIIDEEHRFGVRQKEQLKKLRSQVDILTLTATPIPRTLNFALSGLRDISVIATPPKARLSVKTFVREWSDQIIHEAITREIRRGGQVYFLHNEVQTIEKVREQLTELMPEAKIRVGHGQMKERELETVMRDFYHQRFNVLLCTTIIESGIDIPTANTIIINRADRFGLAQLHQLRGRVGRSHHQAYAYMLTPLANMMTSDAKQRLEAIESLDTLGAGFALASQDLEIRGAGELLGESQSGTIDQIGYSMYSSFLDQAIHSIQRARSKKRGEQPSTEQPVFTPKVEINLNLPARFPDAYLPDVHLRLTMYKRISSASSKESLHELQIECVDRFGLLPEPAQYLFQIAELKLLATEFDITNVEAGPKGVAIKFIENPNIDFDKLMRLVASQPNKFRFKGTNSIAIDADLDSEPDRIKEVRDFLQILSE
ncbi:MAG: transcription-repair coupling factor [Pseudomonadota bacterium]